MSQPDEKKKFKVRTEKKFLRSEDQIYTYPDGCTWDIKSDSDPTKTYMVYNSENEGWLCDCMWFTIHMEHSPPHPKCKHINRIQNLGKQAPKV